MRRAPEAQGAAPSFAFHRRSVHRCLAVLLVLASSPAGCDRRDEPAGTAPQESPAAAPSAARPTTLRKAAPPVDSAGQALPAASREPDWGLDSADPARDYVGRYVRATKRYGAQTSCVAVGRSTFRDGRSVVETHNDATGACGPADGLRDRFFVNVATDRMSLDPSLSQPKLKTWPDGSEPDAPAAKVVDIQDLRAWKTALRDTFHKLQLAPLRVQLYGRGTYPVITLAGWHGAVERAMTPAQLESPAKELCEANEGEPLGVFAALDRSTLLRVSCPGSARFESL